MDRQTRNLFGEYLNQRYKDAGAFTTGDKLEVVQTLIVEAREQGMVPIAQGQVLELDTEDPSFQAILEGKQVSLAGDSAIKRKSAAGKGMAGLSIGARLGIMGGFIVIVVVVMIILLRGCGGKEAEEEGRQDGGVVRQAPAALRRFARRRRHRRWRRQAGGALILYDGGEEY